MKFETDDKDSSMFFPNSPSGILFQVTQMATIMMSNAQL